MKVEISFLMRRIVLWLMPIIIIGFLGGVTIFSNNIPSGEMESQKLYLGCMAIVFSIFSFLFLPMMGNENMFYLSTIWAIILIGGIQAIWGISQVYGFIDSNHSLYALTGSFYNPGPYSGYLAMVFPICLDKWLSLRKIRKITWLVKVKSYLVLGVMLLIVCVLPAGMSRSAWIAIFISSLWIYGIHNLWIIRLREIRKKYKKRVFIATIILGVICLILGYFLFYIKENSANGRLFIWKIALLAITERPFDGYGTNGFASAYGLMQENYFKMNDYSAVEELVAGSTKYAFNEYLQIAVEYGIPFLFILLLIIIFCFWRGITSKHFGACGGLLSVLIFALFSYPLQIPGFALAVYFLLAACAIGHSRILMLFFILAMTLLGVYYLKFNRYDACRDWVHSRNYYNSGDYQSAEKGYAALYPKLKERGVFLFEYGYCLYKLNKHISSIQILEDAMARSSDPMILNILGKNYQSIEEYEKAEEWLIRSTHRLPGRIYPHYLLVKLYADPKYWRPEKLKKEIGVVLTKEPKVQSAAIKEMKKDVSRYLLDLNQLK